jgi:hypothetical protein
MFLVNFSLKRKGLSISGNHNTFSNVTLVFLLQF